MLDRNQQQMILRSQQQAAALAAYVPQGPVLPPAPQQEEAEPNVFAAIFRHAWIVILALALSLGAACVYLNRTEPLYTSAARIYIQPASQRATELQAAERGSYLYTQCELIKSPPLLSALLEDPDVKNLPVFSQIPSQIAYLRKHVEVEVGRKDDIITISVESPNAAESATLVNALVDAYINDRKTKAEGTGNALLARLESDKSKMEKELKDTQQQISTIRRSDPNLQIQGSGGENPAIQQVLVAQQNLIAARNALRDAEQTWGSQNRNIQALQQRAVQADDDYRFARQEALKTSDKRQQIEALQAIETYVRPELENLRRRINELQISDDVYRTITPVMVIEPGEAITKPSFPKKTNTLALAAVVGLILGSTLALIRDRMDTRLRTIEEVQGIVGLPILGVVPRMPGRRTAVARAMAVHLDPRSEVSEAYRTIRTAVYFSGQGMGNRAKTLLVTSPEPGDGKTTSASNLAIAIAQTGRNILLLDADFRKPTQHKNLDVKDAVGLSSVLAGIESLERAIQRTGVEGLDILPCGPIPENPSEILNSQEFGELIDRLAMKYDHILFDSPPANLVTDARILGAVCDATILVLRAEKSTRKAAEHARNSLLSVGANVLGVIVNDVPRGRGYEVYGGTYYGMPEMRHAPTPASRRGGNADHGNGTDQLSRLPRSTSDVSE